MRSTVHDESSGSKSANVVYHSHCPTGRCPGTCAAAVSDIRERIVRHCSPTLAGLKCGSIFRVCLDPHDFASTKVRLELDLLGTGVELREFPLDGALLLYVFRRDLLEGRLSGPGERVFLSRYGYDVDSFDAMIDRLEHRVTERGGTVPEIGLFLDYPLEDVEGFTEKGGKDCVAVGCWKVYGDVEDARRRFELFRRCSDEKHRMFVSGVPLRVLATV